MNWNWQRMLANDIGVAEAEIIRFSTKPAQPVSAPKAQAECAACECSCGELCACDA